MRIIGLMSGTSADGVDACLAEVSERDGKLRARSEAFLTTPYPPDVRRRVLEAASVEDVCRLNFELGELFARAALDVCGIAGADPAEVDAIGSHGQTVFHVADGPRRSTLQIGEPCVIAERTGITTVADFRPRDIAAGGSGAPLVPIVDFLLLADRAGDRAVLNIGGIANVTFLPAGCTVDQVVAFDTGPGNMVIDALMGLLSGGRETCDRDGAAAGRGSVCDRLLDLLLRDEYYSMLPPKSTGRERFGKQFAEGLLATGRSCGLADEDVVATATALTARTIASAITKWGAAGVVIAAGGGVHNPVMMRMLGAALPGMQVVTSNRFGIDPDAKEALAFAVLAYLTLSNRPGNVTGATGAERRAVLGKIVPGRGFHCG